MPSVIHMLGLAVVAAVTIGTVAIYYALNGGDQLQIVDAPPQRRRRRSDVLQPPIQRRGAEMEFQNERDNDELCGLCDRNIRNLEYDLTILPCNHNFHCRCISDHLYRTATNENERIQSTCPVSLCRAPYSIADIQ